MRVGWAILAGLLLAALLYFADQPASERPAWLRAWIEHWASAESGVEPDEETINAAAEVTEARPLYRWRDDAGVLNVGDRPPPDRPYEQVDIPLDRNVVTIRAPEPPPED